MNRNRFDRGAISSTMDRNPSRFAERLWRRGAGLVAFALVSAGGVAADSLPPACDGVSVEATVAEVQARYDRISDFEAGFSQTTRSIMMGGAGLGDETPTTGRVQLAKPGRMRWHYQAPRESLVLSDGETLWIYDVPAKEVTRARVTSGYLAGAALQFLLGEGAIVDSFDVSLLGCADGDVILELMPKEAASYEKLSLVIGSGGVVVGTTIHDLFGNVTALRFEDVRFDVQPKPERFRWAPVDGVKVIELQPASGG